MLMLQPLSPHSQAHRQEEEEEEGMTGASASSNPQNPPKKDHDIFPVGSTVEVLMEDDDFGGVFFTGTVVKPSKKGRKKNSKDKLYVQYHELVVEDGGTEPLKEYVDVSSLRPQPPLFERFDGCFEVGEVVDALYNDGWWTGVVTRLVGGGSEGENQRVKVTFHHPFEVREFGASDLRPHLRWVDGTWIAPEKQDVPVHPFDDGVNSSESMAPEDQPEESAPSPSLRKLKEGDVSGARQQDEIDRTITESPPTWIIRKKRCTVVAAQRVNQDISSVGQDGESSMQPVAEEVVIGENPEPIGEYTNEKNCDAEAERTPGLELPNAPLFKEMSSPPRNHVGGLNLENPKDKSTENDKAPRDDELLREEDKLEDNQQPSAASANEASPEPSDEVILPFAKDNNLWKTIEAMDAFQSVPQTPHFRPLEKLAERSREGLAIGLMVTCANVVKESLSLRPSDPKSIVDSISESLAELETHGFDVRVVRERVRDFIAMKDKQCSDLQEVKTLADQISEREGEKRRNSEEVCEIKKQIEKLRQRVAIIESADAKADEEIDCLGARLRETEEDTKNTVRGFLQASSCGYAC